MHGSLPDGSCLSSEETKMEIRQYCILIDHKPELGMAGTNA